jgi:hypothetical protein
MEELQIGYPGKSNCPETFWPGILEEPPVDVSLFTVAQSDSDDEDALRSLRLRLRLRLLRLRLRSRSRFGVRLRPPRSLSDPFSNNSRRHDPGITNPELDYLVTWPHPWF